MGNNIIVAPSLLSSDFANLQKEIEAVTQAGADWLHIDVMDGHFVPNITIGAPVVKSIKKVSTLPLDVHLMIENPEKYVDSFIEAGADILTIHVEAAKNPRAILEKINQKVKSGITLRPGTPLKEIIPYLNLVDLVLVMTVEPGFGGQEFMKDQLTKVLELSKFRETNKLKFHIEVDGGINNVTAKSCVEAGATALVAGSYVFKSDYKEAIQALKNA